MRAFVFTLITLFLGACPAWAVDRSAIDQAVERGVTALKAMQGPNGTWSNAEIGATALAGLTLLECEVRKDDRAVQGAVRAIRDASYSLTHTYSLALAILFLDKLDEARDTPLIESMIIRLLAGQTATGGWSYECPNLAPAEIQRLRTEAEGTRDLKSGRDLSRLPPKGKRSRSDLPKEILAQLEVVGRPDAVARIAANARFDNTGDNSNTQFATLALWVGRRYGIPTQQALLRVDQRFRSSQNPDGGWSYIPTVGTFMMGNPINTSTATMTCAGLLGIACGHGSALELKKGKDSGAKKDVGKDAALNAGLVALGTAVGVPIGWNGQGIRPAVIPQASGKGFYFLWSLERVAMALNLETIGKKDWYNWGAEVLLASQLPSGGWHGDYAGSGADTCFALLFLKKVNLARDLSGALTGARGGERLLRGGGGLKDGKALVAMGIGAKEKGGEPGTSSPPRPTLTPPRETTPATRTPERTRTEPRRSEDATVARMGDELLKSSRASRMAILGKLRDTRGVPYTETLVWAISKMDGEGKREARVALAERFMRLKDTTLREYLEDEEPEIRRAASLAAAARGSRSLVPALIRRLSDPEEMVQRSAHTALKELTKKDFGPAAGADVSARKEAIAAWLAWWKMNSRE